MDSTIASFLQAKEEENTAMTTIVLPSGETYEVAECRSLPLQVSPLQDWRIRVKIADLGMGKRQPSYSSNSD
jgi:hypothetical protein